jgi:hypothetical protein
MPPLVVASADPGRSPQAKAAQAAKLTTSNAAQNLETVVSKYDEAKRTPVHLTRNGEAKRRVAFVVGPDLDGCWLGMRSSRIQENPAVSRQTFA